MTSKVLSPSNQRPKELPVKNWAIPKKQLNTAAANKPVKSGFFILAKLEEAKKSPNNIDTVYSLNLTRKAPGFCAKRTEADWVSRKKEKIITAVLFIRIPESLKIKRRMYIKTRDKTSKSQK